MENKIPNKSSTKIYWVWRNILLRCKSNHPSHFSKYKKRGIKVCKRWLDFKNFYADMGEIPEGQMTIDRINNNGNYTPSNCRWADKVTQRRNARNLHPITFDGKTQLLTDWAKELGIKVATLNSRLNVGGWTVKDALTKSIMKNRRNRNAL